MLAEHLIDDLQCFGNSLFPVVLVELWEDLIERIGNRSRRNHQLARYLPITEPLPAQRPNALRQFGVLFDRDELYSGF
jgi:hypothetical protein